MMVYHLSAGRLIENEQRECVQDRASLQTKPVLSMFSVDPVSIVLKFDK